MDNQIHSQPLVSFIIPYYNAGSTIQETIDSIFEQTYTNYDIWIINDGSTDTYSIEKLKEYENNPKIHLLHQENLGPSSARNKAIDLCSSKYIIPLDSDDLILPNSLELTLPILEKNNEIDVVYGKSYLFNKKNSIYSERTAPVIGKMLVDNTIPFCSIIRKETFKKVGGLDPWFDKKGLEDWEFWIRLLAEGYNFHFLPEYLFAIRLNHNSRTFQVANKHVDITKEYIYKKHAVFLANQYKELYYLNKQLIETPDYRIGNFLLKPYRWIKNIIKKK